MARTTAGRTDRVARIQAQWQVERPDLDVRPFGVIGRLHRLAGHLTDELVAVYRQHGLGEGDFDVLATLRRSGPPFELTPAEIAAQTMVTTGGMTKRIDRLEAAGLVTRRPSELDGRSRVVGLTAEGTRVIDAAFTDHMANERRLVDQLTPRQQTDLEDLLATWLARYEPAGTGEPDRPG
jgi:DNA-binding MarR family transcriptional regulator